jgi:UDP-2-acetamido-2-deoxy-ribo-hexuluronate aminotransferase
MQFIDLKTQYTALRAPIAKRIQRVLDHGQYIMGPEVAELEAALAARTGAAHCITVASGTEALLIALMALGVGPGDEVITSPFSFASTAEAVVLAGAKPVFVDVDPDTCLIDIALIEAAITPRTRAIMPVSLYGAIPDMDVINAIADRRGVAVIEDAAQSFGATWRGRASGALSTFGCTSFFPSKPLGCYGDGGAIFTSDNTLAQAAREIRVHGQSRRYHHTRIGVGGRMDTLQCAVVLAKLERFDDELARRRALGARYLSLLREIHGVELLRVPEGCDPVWGQFTVKLQQRDRVQQTMQAAGVPTTVHYPKPLHSQPAYEAFAPVVPCPHSEAVAECVLSLPMSADLTHADQDRVVQALAVAVQVALQVPASNPI